MNKIVVFFSIVCALSWIGCKAQKNMATYVDLSSPIEVIYTNSDGIVYSTETQDKMKAIIEILNGAKKTPAKFIALEEIRLNKNDGTAVLIRKNKEFLNIDGVTYILKRKSANQLDELLQKK
jgi:hypothetical protein